jgi:hypothetical protein
MTGGKELSIAILATILGCVSALAQAGGAGGKAQTPPPTPGLIPAAGAEKPELIRTLAQIQDRARKIREAPGNATLSTFTDGIIASMQWFADAATKWSPKEPGEGVPLLGSMKRIAQALTGPQKSWAELATMLAEVRDDLTIKKEHCRAVGLTTPQRVTVVTKRNALEEVKGLEVLYIEKFFQSDANAKPLQFRRFSSPAVDELVPGKYVFWAKQPGESGRRGEQKEARIGNAFTKEPIEVLAP